GMMVDQVNGRVLTGAVTICHANDGLTPPSVTTSNTNFTNGRATVPPPDMTQGRTNCFTTFNWTNVGDSGQQPFPPGFSGILTITPKLATTTPGNRQDFFVTYHNYSSQGQTVYFNLASACPNLSACTWVGGSNAVSVPGAAGGNTGLGTLAFRIQTNV